MIVSFQKSRPVQLKAIMAVATGKSSQGEQIKETQGQQVTQSLPGDPGRKEASDVVSGNLDKVWTSINKAVPL